MRTMDWIGEADGAGGVDGSDRAGGAGGAVEIIDQTALPDELRLLRLSTVDELIDAVRRLAVRGAPALGVAGALGVVLATQQYPDDPRRLAAAIEAVRTARPTAVNLARGVRRAAGRLEMAAA